MSRSWDFGDHKQARTPSVVATSALPGRLYEDGADRALERLLESFTPAQRKAYAAALTNQRPRTSAALDAIELNPASGDPPSPPVTSPALILVPDAVKEERDRARTNAL